MKQKSSAIYRTLAVTGGLDLLLLLSFLLFSRMVHRESGQALLFFTMTLLLTGAVCLFAAIPASRRATLWSCAGISLGLHAGLSVIVTLVGGIALTKSWPGQTNLAWLLTLLLSLTVWTVTVLTVTGVRSHHLTARLHEERRQVKRAKRGYSLEWQTLTPARACLLAVLRGALLILWMHLLTGFLFTTLLEEGLADTMLGFIAFPLLWSLMAAVYGLHDREHRLAYTLSAALCNLALFLLPTALLAVANTPAVPSRLSLYLSDLRVDPFAYPEQLLAVGIFFTVWVSMLVFGIGHRNRRKA